MDISLFEHFIILGVSILLMILCLWIGHETGYKKGQTDAVSGKIKYKLLQFEDGTREYYKESELKNFRKSIKYEIIT